MKPSIPCLMLTLALAIGLACAHAAEELITSLEAESGARPEEKPPKDIVELTVHPAATPRAALQYRLLPSYLDKTYGNAAPMYCKACLMARPEPELWEKVHDWINAPLDELPRDQVRDVVSSFDVVFEQLTLASRRTHCDWGLPFWETDNPFGLVLPELQESRNLARIVALRARLAIANGDLDEAIRSLQVGFALARDVADNTTIVGGLVGLAIASMMSEQIETIVQLPDAPNLYWSLTALPSPFVDMHDALEMESVTIYLMFPQLADVKTKKYTPKQWEGVFDEAEVLSKLEALVRMAQSGSGDNEGQVKRIYHKALQEGLPIVKRELIERGYAQAELDRMPPSQVVVLHTALTFDEARDELFKWFHVPYGQGYEGIDAAALNMLGGAGKDKAGIALAHVMFPALGGCTGYVARLERRIAALRCLEAIRLYAAAHDGKLPASLDDVTEVPIPVNPFTGKPFGYRLEGNTAVLVAEGLWTFRPREYRVTLAE